jgi:hypothetical protein
MTCRRPVDRSEQVVEQAGEVAGAMDDAHDFDAISPRSIRVVRDPG